jgi:GDP-L-fucose synthase
MNLDSKILVLGHRGLVGSAIVRNLLSKNYKYLITIPREECDLRNTEAVNSLFNTYKPEYVFLAAAKVGGILGNKNHKSEMIYDNLMIQNNVIDAAYRNGVKKFMFLGSSCIYPKHAEVPIKEDQLLTGPLEPTNDSYAIAKIAGIKMCQSYREQYGFNAISLMPCNLYGINDNFDLDNCHVLPALIRKLSEAKEVVYHDIGGPFTPPVELWGDGSPMREFLFSDDLAEACHVCMEKYDGVDHINVGTGEDVTIKELAETIADVVGFNGGFHWDSSKPNGTLRKVLNIDKIKSLGWQPKVSLKEGIERTYEWYKRSNMV